VTPPWYISNVGNTASTFKQKKIAQFEELCRQQGLPKTIQRRVILEAVLDREDHPTADQLFEDVKSHIPGVSRTTVYRALEALVQLGVVRRANHSDAVARFDGNTDHHHHLVCLGCDRVTDLDGLKLDFIKLPEGRRKGFEIADFSIHFEGYCPECRRKKTKALSPRAGLRREK
jgi:Fur family transcriptional regulator, peroxide stress response regulator